MPKGIGYGFGMVDKLLKTATDLAARATPENSQTRKQINDAAGQARDIVNQVNARAREAIESARDRGAKAHAHGHEKKLGDAMARMRSELAKPHAQQRLAQARAEIQKRLRSR